MKPHLLLFGFLLATVSLQAKNYNNPYGFYENKGQIIDQNNNLNPTVKYLWTGNGMKVQLKGNSFSYEVMKTVKFQKRNSKRDVMLSLSKHSKAAMDDSTVIYSHRVDIELLNSNPNPEIIAEEKSADYDNYYTTGTPEEGVTFVYHYSKVTYKDIYPNIDLEFVSDAKNEKGFKYNFIVHPGGNVADIQLQYKGATNTTLNKQGNLAVATTSGDFEESIPKSYLDETGENISVHYAAKGGNIFGFIITQSNLLNTLIIDPWATYYGGTNADGLGGICTNFSGNIFNTGITNSINNIATVGSYQTTFGGGLTSDMFIVAFNASGSLLWGTYYGGSGNESGSDCIVADNLGNIYCASSTGSSTNIATSGSYQPNLSGGVNAFLVKFNTSGIRQWATYFGGNQGENFRNMAIDKMNNVYITGDSYSTSGIATSGAHQTINAGQTDAFLAKFSSSGFLLWATYYGGNDEDLGFAVATDKSNNVILFGRTLSTNNIATSGAYQTNLGGVFFAKFNASGVRQWGTYYGPAGDGDPSGITTDKNNNIIAYGHTSSTSGYVTLGAYQTIYGGGNSDNFLVKFDSLGSRIWGTYYGGTDEEYPTSIVADSVGNIFICGGTTSTNNIASSNVYQTSNSGLTDGFVSKFSTSGNLIWGTYFGGSYDDITNGIALGLNKSVIINGGTSSTSGISTPNAYQTSYGGGSYDAFIASFDSTGHIPPVGIQNFNETIPSLIKVYPNPAKDKITVSVKEFGGKAGSISLLSLEGKLLKQQSVKTETTHMDMSGLPSGVYLLQYDDGEVCETVKFVKE